MAAAPHPIGRPLRRLTHGVVPFQKVLSVMGLAWPV